MLTTTKTEKNTNSQNGTTPISKKSQKLPSINNNKHKVKKIYKMQTTSSITTSTTTSTRSHKTEKTATSQDYTTRNSQSSPTTSNLPAEYHTTTGLKSHESSGRNFLTYVLKVLNSRNTYFKLLPINAITFVDLLTFISKTFIFLKQ